MHPLGIVKANLIGLAAAFATQAILASTMALAQENEALRPVTEAGVTYVSGGIGEDETTAIRAMAPKFNLDLVFAQKNGTYLSDVDVVVMSSTGAQIVALKTNGPILLMRVAPGRYLVTATADQAKQTRWVTVPAHGRAHLSLHW